MRNRFPWLARGTAQAPADAGALVAGLEAVSAPISLPGGSARFSSIAWPLIGVLVLIASCTVGISYYFHHQSAGTLYELEQRSQAERAARVVESSLRSDHAAVERAAKEVAERPELATALAKPDGSEPVPESLQRLRQLFPDIQFSVFNVRGELVG